MNILNNRDHVGCFLLLAFALFYLVYTYQIPLDPTAGDEFFTPRTLPTGLALATIFFSILQMVVQREHANISDSVAGFRWKPTILLALLMLAYSLLFSFLGFFLATLLFLLLGFSILGETRYVLSGSVAVGLTLFMWLVLTKMFHLYLDSGTLWRLMTGGVA